MKKESVQLMAFSLLYVSEEEYIYIYIYINMTMDCEMETYLTRVERQGESKVVVDGNMVVVGVLMRGATTATATATVTLLIACFLFNLPSDVEKIIDRTW